MTNIDPTASRWTRRALAAAAVVLALGAAAAGSPRSSTTAAGERKAQTRENTGRADHLSALQLAEWLRARRPDLRVIDVRPDSEFEQFHIPNAEHLALTALGSIPAGDGRTVVLYSGDDGPAAQGWEMLSALGHRRVYALHGGVDEWIDSVMSPVRAPGRLTDSAWARQAALSRYFGGVPRLGDAQTPGVTGAARVTTTGAATARVIRRGC